MDFEQTFYLRRSKYYADYKIMRPTDLQKVYAGKGFFADNGDSYYFSCLVYVRVFINA